ncbi:MAG: hypothetical protein JKX81_08325 [Arenicella sp.]|nr:hypothetical protein [Arenicella sp.]
MPSLTTPRMTILSLCPMQANINARNSDDVRKNINNQGGDVFVTDATW